MKTFEYRSSNFDAEQSDEQMNILGRLGWEVIQISHEKEYGYMSGKFYVTIYFKREIPHDTFVFQRPENHNIKF